MSILIKGALLNNRESDIYIDGNIISEINDRINTEADYKIAGKNKAAIPSFVNGHTHAAMTLLRGYAEDMELMPWLQEKIWPAEAKMREEDIYWGAKLACIEMIKTGTTMFFDMYHYPLGTSRATKEMGTRSIVTEVFFDKFEKDWNARKKILIDNIAGIKELNSPLVNPGLGPHAIYTMTEEGLLWTKEFADKNNLKIHFHLSESKGEVEDCITLHGMRPVEYLEKIGFLSDRLVVAHAVWLSDKELDILAKRKVSLVHNPVSNMKLSVGNVFRFEDAKKRKIKMALGTDGSSSNNSLDMFEDMKIAGLLQKHHNNPTHMSAKDVFDMATKHGAEVFGLNSGEIKEGKLADLLLLDMKHHLLIPNHNLISNIVYSANGSCVDTTICNGKVLMENRIVEGEDDIIYNFSRHAEKLVK